MLSMPPATTTRLVPATTVIAEYGGLHAAATGLFTVTAPVDFGMPAPMAAWRGTPA